MNLRISKDLVKEAVCDKLERYQSLPMVMQTLENNNLRNDEIHENLDTMMQAEFENIEKRYQMSTILKKIQRNSRKQWRPILRSTNRI